MRVFGDVLSFLRNDILRDRETPFLWSDTALCECIAQAHDEYAERTRCIRDSSSYVTRVALEEGVSQYVLNPAVISVLSAQVDGQPVGMVRAGIREITGEEAPMEALDWVEAVNAAVPADGLPRVFRVDEGVDGGEHSPILHVHPAPSAAYDTVEVLLRVVRLPLTQCAVDTLEDIVDAPRQALMSIANGAAAYAYSMQDSDGGDSSRAEQQRKLFEAAVARGAASTRSRLFQPMKWGFGRGGFSHS